MKEVIEQAVSEVLKQKGWPDTVCTVEHPTELTHGDYACNVAMILAKQLNRSPVEIAAELQKALSKEIEYVDTIVVAGPGFLNFFLSRDFFVAETLRAKQAGNAWGHNDSWQNKTVLVEYTDPNPFKEFHVGHLFTNAVGESLARLFMVNGADTKRVCYQGDVGMHVANAIWGMQQLGLSATSDITASDLGRAYTLGASTYKAGDPAVVEEMKRINTQVYEKEDATIHALYEKGRQVSLEYFEQVYRLLGTQFAEYFFESEAGPRGKELVLGHPEVFTKSDGAYIFTGEEHGLHTRVFVNAEGLPTYEAKELALAKIKEERLGQYDWSVIATANEINEYFKVLLCAMEKLYPELAHKTEHIGHGMVRLQTGKMSSRTGAVIKATDFVDEIATEARARIIENQPHLQEDTAKLSELSESVAIAAIKYSTLKGNIRQDSVFDKESALSFEGDSGPYLQYTYARIGSVRDKARAAGVAQDISAIPENPYTVEKILYRFPEVTRNALVERSPHHVTNYLTKLASEYNTFYATERIADPEDMYAPYKVALSEAVALTLKNGLWILGIQTPERM